MYVVIKKSWKRVGQTVMGGRNASIDTLELDRIVMDIEDIKKGEYYCELKIK